MNSFSRVMISPLTISYLIMIILLIATSVSLSRHYDKTSKMHRLFWHIILAAFFLSTTAYFGLMSPTAKMALIFHSVNGAIYDLAIFELFIFTCLYTSDDKVNIIESVLIGIPITFNIVTKLAGILTRSYIDVELSQAYNNSFYTYVEGPMYWINWTISILVVAASILKMLIAYAKAPQSFKGKYSTIIWGIMLCFSFNMVFLGIGLEIDLSPIFSSLVVVVAYYCAVLRSPSSYIKKIKAIVLENMDDAIIIKDHSGRLKMYNEATSRLLGYEDSNAEEAINSWIERNNIDVTSDEPRSIHDTLLESNPYLTVHCHQFREPKTPDIITASYIQIHDRSDEVKAQEKLYYTATRDSLTGLLNRNSFYEESEEILGGAHRNNYYIVCTDLENFKMFNEVFGVQAGDDLLVNIAQGLQSLVSGIKCIGRLGADRFAILMDKDMFSESEYSRAFQSAVSRMENTFYAVNTHIGVVEVEDNDLSVASMCDRALVAIQSMKGKAGGFVAFYDNALMEEKRGQKKLYDELKRAIEEDEFIFYIQPQISSDGDVHGGEALVRWNHPTRGILSPFYFINALEENAMIADLDYKIWTKVCRKLKEWKDAGHGDMYISVNISPRDFYYRDIYKTFTELVKRYDIDSGKIKLEITESAIMQNTQEQISLINNLREAGFTVEMDDFGSGYSSLNILSQLSVDVLKIDMGFLQRGLSDTRNAEMIKLIQNMGIALGMKTIVEGVETQEQADFLKSIGCEMFQGYLYSMPVPVAEFEEKYLK